MIKVVIKEAILKIVFFSSERARAAIEKQEIWEDDASRNAYYELFFFFAESPFVNLQEFN